MGFAAMCLADDCSESSTPHCRQSGVQARVYDASRERRRAESGRDGNAEFNRQLGDEAGKDE